MSFHIGLFPKASKLIIFRSHPASEIPGASIDNQSCDPAQVRRGHYYLLATRVEVGDGVAVSVIVEVSAGISTTSILPLAVCCTRLSSQE